MIDISKAVKIQGWMSEIELRFLSKLASEHDFVVEVGSWRGRSTYAIARHVRECCVSIDTFRGTKDPENGHYDGGHEVAEDLGGDRVYLEFMRNTAELQAAGKLISFRCRSVNGAALVHDIFGKVTCVFLDGAHDPQGIIDDINAFRKIMVPGSYLYGHDAKWPKLWQSVLSTGLKPEIVADSIWSAVVD